MTGLFSYQTDKCEYCGDTPSLTDACIPDKNRQHGKTAHDENTRQRRVICGEIVHKYRKNQRKHLIEQRTGHILNDEIVASAGLGQAVNGPDTVCRTAQRGTRRHHTACRDIEIRLGRCRVIQTNEQRQKQNVDGVRDALKNIDQRASVPKPLNTSGERNCAMPPMLAAALASAIK